MVKQHAEHLPRLMSGGPPRGAALVKPEMFQGPHGTHLISCVRAARQLDTRNPRATACTV